MDDDHFFGVPNPPRSRPAAGGTGPSPGGNRPATPAAPAAAGPPAGAAPAPPVELGCIDGNQVLSTAADGAVEVQRTVHPDVRYQRPPLGRTWRERSAQRLSITLAAHPAAHPTLASLGQVLRAARAERGELPADHPAGVRFDRAVDSLLQSQQALHDAGWTLGLAHPKNLLFEEPSYALLAVDLGFSFDGDLAVPAWIRSHPGKEFWGAEATDARQVAWGNAPLPADRQASEVVITARMVASVLFDSTAPPHDPARPASRHLHDALAGKVATPGTWRESLKLHPLSQLFTPPPPPPKPEPGAGSDRPTRSKRGWVVAGVLLLAGVGGFLAQQRGQTPPTPAGTPTTPEVAKADPKPEADAPPTKQDTTKSEQPKPDLTKAAQLLGQVQSQPAEKRGEGIQQLSKLLGAQSGPEAERLKAAADAARDPFFASWRDRIQRIQNGADPDENRNESIEKLDRLIMEFSAYVTEYPALTPNQQLKEKQCYEFAVEFLAQLRLR